MIRFVERTSGTEAARYDYDYDDGAKAQNPIEFELKLAPGAYRLEVDSSYRGLGATQPPPSMERWGGVLRGFSYSQHAPSYSATSEQRSQEFEGRCWRVRTFSPGC